MRALLVAVAVLAVTACKEKASSPPAEAPKSAEKEKLRADHSKAEVEFFGKWTAGEVKAAKVVFVAQLEPCTPVPEKPTRFGEQKLDAPGPLFAEFFIPQGTVGHACVYALDEAGKVVGAASSTQNPLTFRGEGEVIFGKLEFSLRAP